LVQKRQKRYQDSVAFENAIDGLHGIAVEGLLDGALLPKGPFAGLDVYKPERWIDDALFRPEVRQAFRRLIDQGWTDALRALHPTERIYTFWDYFRNAWARNGLRIDHLLLNPALAQRLFAAGVDRDVRGWEKASDHAPVWIEVGNDRKSGRKSSVGTVTRHE
jgi:exodeoxyribonuclease-3